MNSNHENDAFELRFEDAVNDMHQRKDRGDQPSAHVWQSIRSHIGAQAETADPRANGRDQRVEQSTVQRSRTMDATLATREFGYKENRSTRLGWMSLLAAGLVGIMIFTSVWMNGSAPPPDDGSDLAWAPGMGSPQSSPMASNSCTIEPLTTDEVMAMVMNPSNGYVRLGLTDYKTSEDQFFESSGYRINDETDKAGYVRNGDLEVLHTAAAAANMYSNCVQTGTLYQVWAIMDPAIVQLDILSRFPVLRNDEQLRSFVEKWGPERFPGDGHGIIGRFPGQAKTENGSDWLGSTMIDGRTNDLAVISIYAQNDVENRASVRTEISLQLYQNGEWIITGLYPVDLRG